MTLDAIVLGDAWHSAKDFCCYNYLTHRQTYLNKNSISVHLVEKITRYDRVMNLHLFYYNPSLWPMLTLLSANDYNCQFIRAERSNKIQSSTSKKSMNSATMYSDFGLFSQYLTYIYRRLSYNKPQAAGLITKPIQGCGSRDAVCETHHVLTFCHC